MVTITGSYAGLASGGFGISGRIATLEIVPRHPSGDPTQYAGFIQAVLSTQFPLTIALTTGAGIPAATTILASSALRPAGSYYHVTWRVAASSTYEAEEVSYDCFVGPDGGTCDITDPANRIDAGSRAVLAGWPVLPPVVVYSSEGSS